MPELAEVQTVVDTLKGLIKDKCIRDIDIYYPRIIEGDIESFKKRLIGQHFRRFLRRGKYLLFEMDDVTLVSHLRMEGKYFFEKGDAPNTRHTHVVFYFTDGTKLAYNDTRKFGRMELIAKRENYDDFKNLGPEPFSDHFNVDYICHYLADEKKAIKTVLLDQHFVAGIGNIYADEILFAIKVNPLMPAMFLDIKTIERLIEETRRILNAAIKAGGTTIRSYTSSLGVTGRFQLSLRAHQKEGEPCPDCETLIVKTKVGGRGTYYCPHCQILPHRIALTGMMGSGKSTVLAYLEEKYAFKTFSADKEVRRLYKEDKEVQKHILTAYPELAKDEMIDLTKLAALIFHDAKAKKAIESLIFPRVLESYKAFSIHETITIAEIPLLYEAQMDKYFDHVLVLSSKQKVALERLKKRGLKTKDVKERTNSQMPIKEKIKRADWHITNDGTLAELYAKIDMWIDKDVRKK